MRDQNKQENKQNRAAQQAQNAKHSHSANSSSLKNALHDTNAQQQNAARSERN